MASTSRSGISSRATSVSDPRRRALAAALAAVVAAGPASAAPREIPGPPGPFTNSAGGGACELGGAGKIVGTYYFYWYDSTTGAHLRDADGSDALTDHPASLEDFSWRSVRWHRKELADMAAAGIDLVLPVFWGAPSEHGTNALEHWSYGGLPPLVEARDSLLREGVRAPAIGLFYDTSTLQHNRWGEHVDCSTERGRQWFYATIRDFFSMIPPRHRATIGGKPVVLTYAAAFTRAHDPRVFEYVAESFVRDFAGPRPWMAFDLSWNILADGRVSWGGALGLRTPGIASLGPGYDHSAVPGRAPLIVPRRDGAFYEENWHKLLRNPSRFVMLETWNEFHEGTDLGESREYGRRYIELTRKYTDLLRQGWTPPWPKGPFSGAESVGVTLGAADGERGLRRIDVPDGRVEAAPQGGLEPVFLGNAGHGYVYFAADDSFKWTKSMHAELEVEYFDTAKGQLSAEFDGSETNAAWSGAYTGAPGMVRCSGLGGTGWKRVTFELKDALLLGRQNGGADLRVVVRDAPVPILNVTLRRR